MTAVRPVPGGVELTLSELDARLLSSLAGQVAVLLGEETTAVPADPLELLVGGTTGPVDAPDDAALRRLLPDAYADDAPAASEFRRLTDGDLRRLKIEALQRLAAAPADAPVQLGADDAELWLQAINDVRLVLGVRLDIREDGFDQYAGIAADDPRVPLLVAYDRLTWLQDALIDALDA